MYDIEILQRRLERERSARHQAETLLEEKSREIYRASEELQMANLQLKEAITERINSQEEKDACQRKLLETSRLAGMAEVATGVLHNVGNVLNSVNVSANLLMEKLQTSRVDSLIKASDVIAQHQDELAAFLTEDPQGKHFPRFLQQLTSALHAEQDLQTEELRSLIDNIEHIKEIVSMQQTFAQVRGATEPLNLVDLVEDSLKINDAGLIRHNVEVKREFDEVPPMVMEKHKVMQILINLISNAKYALSDSPRDDKIMMLVVAADQECMRVQVRDNGVGIAQENLTKIFNHGFTTKKDGHGFGLHSSALAAQELGGSLSVHSDGLGQGATFTLQIPLEKESLCKV